MSRQAWRRGAEGVEDGVVPADTLGTPGDDRLRGTPGGDTFDVSQGGDDVVKGKGGDDTFYFGAAFTGADRVNGGDNVDTVILDGDYAAGVEVQASCFDRVEKLVLEGGSYAITGELAFKDQFGWTVVDAGSLTSAQALHLDVSALGYMTVNGGHGDDMLHASASGMGSFLFGGDGDDTLIGGAGNNLLAGAGGADRIVMVGSGDIATYGDTSHSTAKAYDTIENFAASGGRIELFFDSDTSKDGVQSDFHFDKTADRTGNILFKYDAQLNETVVKVFTDADHKADCVIHLTGDVPLTPADFIFG